ncbi:MAG: hypothetical protein IH892_13410 [Planctomycetes bacterium]|nr:hypothetical protein [Planctomycetota bacterium]
MRQRYRNMSFRRITRFGRRLVAYAVVSMLLVGSFTAQAILIHDHHGHETHVHRAMVHDLDEWRENSEHHHAEHEHDDRPADPTQDEDPSIVIVLDLPVALPRVQGVSSGVAVSNIAPALTVLATDASATSDGRPPTGIQTSCARSLVADILLAGHALLL